MSPTSNSNDPTGAVWTALIAGDADAFLGLFADPSTAVLNDPIHGASIGEPAIRTTVTKYHHFFSTRLLDSTSPPPLLRSTRSKRRHVAEHTLTLKSGLVWDEKQSRGVESTFLHLPVAYAARLAPGTPKTTATTKAYDAIHLYFGTWSVTGGNNIERAGFVDQEELDPVPVVDEYFRALAAGDLSATLACYEHDGYFREPSDHHVCGQDALRPHYAYFYKDGGIDVRRRSSTVEGPTVAYEIQTHSWGKKAYEKTQAGLAVYDLGRNGRIVAARVYDSAVPPL
ncbi:hypothetical protein HK101_001487 [Irineochytrium annulatum]|nr:hypothetical protein HK101_001487 [Irineochytrium annulatum]